MEKMDKATEGRVLLAVERAVRMTKEGMDSSKALLKVAEEERFHPEIVKRMAEAMNVSRTRAHMQSAPAEKRAETFPLVDAGWVINQMYPEVIELPAQQKAAAWIPDELLRPETENYFEPRKRTAPLVKAADLKAPPVKAKPTQGHLLQKQAGLKERERTAKSDFRSAFFDLFKEAEGVALQFRDAHRFNFPEVERRVFAKYGSAGKKMMDMLYAWGGLGKLRRPIKRASLREGERLIWDGRQTPYNWIDSLCKKADHVEYLAKAAVDREYELAVFNNEHGFRQAWEPERSPGPLDDIIDPPPFALKRAGAGSIADQMLAQRGQQTAAMRLKQPATPPKTVAQGVAPADYKARLARLKSQGVVPQTTPGQAAVAQHAKGGSADAVPFSKEALDPLTTGMTMGSMALGLKEPPELSKYRQILAEVYDPVHESKLQAIKSKAMINDFLSNDPILSSYDPEVVTNMYNQIATMAPNAARQPALMRGLLRKSIQQGGVLEPFETQQLTQVEKAFKGDTAPAMSPLFTEKK